MNCLDAFIVVTSVLELVFLDSGGRYRSAPPASPQLPPPTDSEAILKIAPACIQNNAGCTYPTMMFRHMFPCVKYCLRTFVAFCLLLFFFG
eukprot:COSAG05_NODE_1395_length_4993_cov_6.265836_4_plen_91_part_00